MSIQDQRRTDSFDERYSSNIPTYSINIPGKHNVVIQLLQPHSYSVLHPAGAGGGEESCQSSLLQWSLCFSHKLCSSHMVVKDTAGPFETTQMKFKSSRLWTSPGIKQWTTHYGPDFNWFHNYAKHSERHRELQLTVKCAFLISQAAALLSTDYIQLFQHYFSYCRWE